MLVFSPDDVERILSYPKLVEVLRASFQSDIIAPLRHHHAIERGERAQAFMLLMPAWSNLSKNNDGYMGIKLANVFPDNGDINKSSVQASYILMNGRTGETLAFIDGATLTTWRTAAASALGADYLARKDASQMVMVGVGAIAPYLIRAHASVRPITHVTIWNRNIDKAAALARKLEATLPMSFSVSDDLESAVREADIVSSATLSTQALILGKWLKPGCHLDLVGAFTAHMRESDDECVRRADLFVDTRQGALNEAGDIVQPIKDNVINASDVLADLFDLTRKTHLGRTSDDAITLFKSTGASLEDLSTAIYLYEHTKESD